MTHPQPLSVRSRGGCRRSGGGILLAVVARLNRYATQRNSDAIARRTSPPAVDIDAHGEARICDLAAVDHCSQADHDHSRCDRLEDARLVTRTVDPGDAGPSASGSRPRVCTLLTKSGRTALGRSSRTCQLECRGPPDLGGRRYRAAPGARGCGSRPATGCVSLAAAHAGLRPAPTTYRRSRRMMAAG